MYTTTDTIFWHGFSCSFTWCHFVQSVSFKNHLNRSFWLAVREFPPVRKWFLGLALRTKRTTPGERTWKTVPENYVRNCVHFCLKPPMTLERCDLSHDSHYAQQIDNECSHYSLLGQTFSQVCSYDSLKGQEYKDMERFCWVKKKAESQKPQFEMRVYSHHLNYTK